MAAAGGHLRFQGLSSASGSITPRSRRQQARRFELVEKSVGLDAPELHVIQRREENTLYCNQHQMKTQTQVPLRHVWISLIVPPILLGILIFGYALFSGAASAGAQEMEGAVRGALPYIIAVNHTLVFAMLLYLLRQSGRGLADIGWSVQGVAPVVREVAIGLVVGIALYNLFVILT